MRCSTAGLALPIILLFCSAPSAAQDEELLAASLQADPPAPSDEIIVTGTRASTLDLPRLLKAQKAFLDGRAAFAPTASLFFRLRAAPDVELNGMTLTLRNGDAEIAVPIDSEQRFSLPELPAGRCELVHNRGAARIAVRALVLSAGASEDERPLGDLRLQCRAGWELAKGDYPFIARAGFGAVGGCSRTRIAFFFRTPQSIATATLSAGDRIEELPLRPDRSAFRAPLGTRDWPNDAVIRVSYR